MKLCAVCVERGVGRMAIMNRRRGHEERHRRFAGWPQLNPIPAVAELSALTAIEESVLDAPVALRRGFAAKLAAILRRIGRAFGLCR